MNLITTDLQDRADGYSHHAQPQAATEKYSPILRFAYAWEANRDTALE